MSLTEKNSFWTKVVSDIEREAYERTLAERIRNYDFSLTLPNSLRKRVEKILEYEYDEFDRNVFIVESSVDTPISFGEDEVEVDDGFRKKKQTIEVFNESTCSEIERMEHEFLTFDLVMDKPVEHKVKQKKKRNWCSTYICKPRKERVRWDSKIYELEGTVWEKTLDEQAEQLMDASAERFTEWLNSLGSGNQSYITKEKLKSFFSIEGDRKLLASIITEPKEVKAIAKTVADKWNLPEMALELKYEQYIRDRFQNIPKSIIKVAFGRTVPMKDRPWLPSENDTLIRSAFPQELLTFEKLFKGITHLRSTRALVDFYKKTAVLERPQYLVVNGHFKGKQQAATTGEVPLYELLKLKY
uniref:Uncharacterized protein n=1 Tax=Glossina brevipalpis TaxID=37001 RepID=A0A1A9WCH2_9MUSC